MQGDAAHGHFIPLSIAEVKRQLFDSDLPEAAESAGLARVCELIEALYHHRLHDRLKRLKASYERLDPSASTLDMSQAEGFLSLFESLLEDGNWKAVGDAELQAALEGEDVFPISLEVPFEEFVQMRLFKLGQSPVTDTPKQALIHRVLRRPAETRMVDVYDRVVMAIQFQSKEWFEENGIPKRYPGDRARGLHLRLFASIPKLDLEVIFPNTKPMMKVSDKIKIIAPLIGGLVSLGMKFGPVLLGADQAGDTSLSLLGGILAALGSYMLKSYLKFRKTKEEYLIAVSQDLFFKGQANDEAVIMSILDLAESQEVKEAIIAYTFLLREADAGHDQTSLDAQIEQWLAERDAKVDFEVDDALGKLLELGLLTRGKTNDDGRLAWDGEEWVDAERGAIGSSEAIGAVPVKAALVQLDSIWDDLYAFEE